FPHHRVVGIGRSPENDTHFTHCVSWGHSRCRAPLPSALVIPDKSRYQYYVCSLNDNMELKKIAVSHQPRIVFNLAAALRDAAPTQLIETNVIGTINLLNVLGLIGDKPRLVLGSSGSVYGGNNSPRCRESDRCSPSEPYAVSKLASEQCATVLASSLNVDLVISRIFNIAGPGQDERHVCGMFAAQSVAVLTGAREPQIAVGDLTPARDFIDVRDVAEALVAVARFGAGGAIYNVASGFECVIGTILEKILKIAGVFGKVKVEQRYARRHDVSRQRADVRLLRSLGYRPQYTMDATLRDVVDYYKALLHAKADGTPLENTSGG
ncbi:MAG: GDP-mannose 4,6-dehydratase, partial [Candidatus Cybelea sp.]